MIVVNDVEDVVKDIFKVGIRDLWVILRIWDIIDVG